MQNPPDDTSNLVVGSIFRQATAATPTASQPEEKHSIYDLPRLIIAFGNMHRLSTRFTILTLKTSLLLARENHWLDNLEVLLGRSVNIAILDAPLGVYSSLSVGLFIARNLINATDILQHTFFPDEDEASLTKMDRFGKGLYHRHTNLANDSVWGLVNALCNYGVYFGIPAATTNYLMVGFTGFDVALLTLDLYLKRQEYLIASVAPNLTPEEKERIASDYEKFRSAQLFYIVAANIMLGSFAIGFLFLPPAYISVCFLICNVAIAMYLSGSKYGEWSDAHRILKLSVDHNQDRAPADKAVQKSWDDLGFAMAKNIIAPFVFLGAFTVSVPAAIGLTLAYAAYEAYNVGLEAKYFTSNDAASGLKSP